MMLKYKLAYPQFISVSVPVDTRHLTLLDRVLLLFGSYSIDRGYTDKIWVLTRGPEDTFNI